MVHIRILFHLVSSRFSRGYDPIWAIFYDSSVINGHIYHFFIGTDDSEVSATIAWGSLAPILHTQGNKIYMSYKLKTDDPSVTFGSNTIYTTRHANEFYIRCAMDNFVELTSSAVTMETLELGAATNGTGTTEIDPSSIFSLGTFTDTQANSGSSQSSFTLGDTVFGFVGASSMSTMPSAINWEVNECVVSIFDGLR